MKGIGTLLNKKHGELVFSILCGIAYFIIVLYFILRNTQSGGTFLSFMFAPAIVCGMALALIKSIRRLKEEEEFFKINLLIYAHIVLALVSLVFLYDIIF